MKRHVAAIVFITLLTTIAISARLLWRDYLRSSADLAQNAEMGNFLKNASRFEKRATNEASIAEFRDSFFGDYSLEEAGAISESPHPHWWVNSGARLVLASGMAGTIQGGLRPEDPWYVQYRRHNPRDTDNGSYPQNIFRLVETDQWENFSQQMYFKINRLNQSDSPNRNASNGLFLFNRYQTGDNLYYTGLRVDGAAVIKKKINGQYYTMAYQRLYSGGAYDRNSNPNLLPLDTWLGLKSEVVTNPDKSVTIRFYTDIGRTGAWTLALETTDISSAALTQPGYAGIRTDFMDVSFKDYKISAI